MQIFANERDVALWHEITGSQKLNCKAKAFSFLVHTKYDKMPELFIPKFSLALCMHAERSR